MSCGCVLRGAVMPERYRWRMQYIGGSPLEIVGPITKTVYQFSGRDAVQLIQPSDGVGIARCRLFRVIGVVDMTHA